MLKNEQFCKYSSLKCNEKLLQYILNRFGINEISKDTKKQIKLAVKVYVTKLLTKWRDCKYMYDSFNNKHMKWLEEHLNITKIKPSSLKNSEERGRGRPRKFFEESVERSKN